MEYLSTTETAEKWGLGIRQVQTLCVNGRVKGAYQIGSTWAIPKNAPKPSDARIKSGKYVKPKEDAAQTE